VFHLSQQQGSRLRNFVRTETQNGESQFFDRIGSVTAQELTSRHSDTPQIDTPHSRRRVTLTDYVHADLVDTVDKIRMLMDPTSEYSKSFMWAMGRAMDDKIIENADGNAFGGVDGGTTVAHPNEQKLASVSGGAGANLNVQALRRAKKKFDEDDIDPSIRRYIAHQASQAESLLSETEITSSDFNTVKALVQGELSTFLGFTYIRLERLLTQSGALLFDVTSGEVGAGAGDADGYRRVLAWAQDGLLLAVGQDMQAEIDRRADKNFSTQVFARMSIGATRMEEEKVVVILSDES
jgi:hypothetical protein